MSNEAIYIQELPTLDFIMREVSERKTESGAGENQRIGKLFCWFAAAQIGQITSAAILGFFVAPASHFAPHYERLFILENHQSKKNRTNLTNNFHVR